MFSCEFCKISKNTVSYRTPPVAASVGSQEIPIKIPRKNWSRTQVNALVNAWKENISLIESTRCNEGWGNVKDAVAKHGQEKTVTQCKSKI